MNKLLSQIDESQIRKVIEYSQDIENPKLDELLRIWSVEKRQLANKFLGGKTQLTFQEKVQFDLGLVAKEQRYSEFVEYIINILGNNWNHPLVRFLDQVAPESFYSNTVQTQYCIDVENNKYIPKGAKVIKAFRYFIEDEKLLRDLQDRASMIIQENKIEGYLTFSVHPLDFLSSSENTYNWRSCHALDGEYRAGNLSYMCDRSTMMVYLSDQEPHELPHFPPDVKWNSKKWRMLIHFDDELEACFAGRQYPFFSVGSLNIVKDIFQNYLAPIKTSMWGHNSTRESWHGWYNDYLENVLRSNGETNEIEEARYCVMNGGVYDRYAIVKDAPNSRHFNDVTRSSCYEKPYYMYKHYYGPFEKLHFTIGAPVVCLKCGEHIIDGQDTMMCIDCECEFGNSDSDCYRTCDCCGSRFYFEAGYWVGEDDEMVCPQCAEKETFICSECGNRHYNANKVWDENLENYVCGDCAPERNEEYDG